MKRLHCINIMHISILILFVYAEVVEVIGQSVITAYSETSHTKALDESIMKLHDNGCKCINYNCGCCQFIEFDTISVNGTLCANASYLEYDYGMSLTVTYNNFAIINETVSGKNPPPICIGENFVDTIEFEVCLHIYDIEVDSGRFHACFEIFGKIMKIRISSLQLGCFNTKLYKKLKYIKNNVAFNPFLFLKKKRYSILTNTIN